MTTETPALFHWGLGGVPGEFRLQLITAEQQARTAKGLPRLTEGRPFYREGVEWLARERRALLRNKREKHAAKKPPAPSQGKRQEFRPHADDTEWTWLLLKHCAEAGEPPPPELQWLIFETLGLEEGKPALGRDYGGPRVSDPKKWIMAAQLDGEADARGEELSASKLAEAVGVDRQSITRWRDGDAYKRRRDGCRVNHLCHMALKGAEES